MPRSTDALRNPICVKKVGGAYRFENGCYSWVASHVLYHNSMEVNGYFYSGILKVWNILPQRRALPVHRTSK